MKKILLIVTVFLFSILMACKRTDWAEGTLSPVISIEDLRLLFTGEDLILNSSNLAGATKIAGVVISEGSSGNIPEGVLVVQNTRRKKVRGINLYLGSQAANYKPGDSVLINIEGSVLKQEKGALILDRIASEAVQLVSEHNTINISQVSIDQLQVNSSLYESTLVKIYAGDFIPEPVAGDYYIGDKIFSDGTGEITIHTEATASYSSEQMAATASVVSIAMMYLPQSADEAKISLWPRNIEDIKAKTVILAWNLLGAVGNETTSSSTITNPNLELSTLSRGPGIAPQTAGDSYASTFPINADKAAAISVGTYYQFTIKPKGNATISLSALDIILRIQTNAPKTYIWMYSMDNGFSFKEIGTPYTWTTGFSENNGIQQPQLNLSSVNDLQHLVSGSPIIFRLYAWGGTSITSNNGFRIGKSRTVTQHALTIEGTIIEENTL